MKPVRYHNGVTREHWRHILARAREVENPSEWIRHLIRRIEWLDEQWRKYENPG